MGGRLTNIGCFRAYCIEYLKRSNKINHNMTFLVRQLVPLQRKVCLWRFMYSQMIQGGHYEAIQADIFDHLFAVLPEFGLRAYQLPSGRDLSFLKQDS